MVRENDLFVKRFQCRISHGDNILENMIGYKASLLLDRVMKSINSETLNVAEKSDAQNSQISRVLLFQ